MVDRHIDEKKPNFASLLVPVIFKVQKKASIVK